MSPAVARPHPTDTAVTVANWTMKPMSLITGYYNLPIGPGLLCGYNVEEYKTTVIISSSYIPLTSSIQLQSLASDMANKED